MKHTPENKNPDRVKTETDRVYAELDTMLGSSLTRKQLKELARHYIAYQERDWYAGYKQGLVKGRQEAQAIIDSAAKKNKYVESLYGPPDTKAKGVRK
jgi:hypothetical protein